jgi:hypothetical protein
VGFGLILLGSVLATGRSRAAGDPGGRTPRPRRADELACADVAAPVGEP